MRARQGQGGARFAYRGRVKAGLMVSAWRRGFTYAPRRMIVRRRVRPVVRYSSEGGGAIGRVAARRMRHGVVTAGRAGAAGGVAGLVEGHRIGGRFLAAVRRNRGFIDPIGGVDRSMGARFKSDHRVAASAGVTAAVAMQGRRSVVARTSLYSGKQRAVGSGLAFRQRVRAKTGAYSRLALPVASGIAAGQAEHRGVAEFFKIGSLGGTVGRSVAPVGRLVDGHHEGVAWPRPIDDRRGEPGRRERDAPSGPMGGRQDHRGAPQLHGVAAREAGAQVAPEMSVQPQDIRRMMGDLFADEGRRPPAGLTGFDGRLSPIFAGRKPGF